MVSNFIKEIWRNRFVVYQMVKRDYKNRYIGSFLGFAWTIIQPLVMMMVLWFVFAKAFKNGPVDGTIPFISWIAVGIIAWNFFAETLSSSTSVFLEYSYLVKKNNFRLEILPIIKLFSALITHLIFIGIAIIIIIASGMPFSWYWFQIIYYLVALCVLLFGLSLICSCLQIFMRDTSQIVAIALQFGFWLTPIIWNFNLLPDNYKIFLELNPMFYIVEGYRKSFIFHEPFWSSPYLTIYFWALTWTIAIMGVLLFKKLRPHFVDVL